MPKTDELTERELWEEDSSEEDKWTRWALEETESSEWAQTTEWDEEEEETIWEKWEDEQEEEIMRETTITMAIHCHQEAASEEEVKEQIEEDKMRIWWEISFSSNNSEKKWIEAEDLEVEVEEWEVDLEIEEDETSSKWNVFEIIFASVIEWTMWNNGKYNNKELDEN